MASVEGHHVKKFTKVTGGLSPYSSTVEQDAVNIFISVRFTLGTKINKNKIFFFFFERLNYYNLSKELA